MSASPANAKGRVRWRAVISLGISVVVVVLVYAMGFGPVSAEDYVTFVKDPENGLCKTVTAGEFDFTLQYQPLEFVALLEQRGENLTEEQLNKAKEERDGLQYFVFKIMSRTGQEVLETGAQSEEEVQMRQYYFTTLMNQDMALVEGGDTLSCALWHFERNYGLAPYNNIVVAFEKPEKGGDKTFIYNDEVLGAGSVRFDFSEADIAAVPELKLD